MKFTKMFADGIERKLTIDEFFDINFESHQQVEIVSASKGLWVSGTVSYCIEHLDKYYLGACVQSATTNGTITTVYVH